MSFDKKELREKYKRIREREKSQLKDEKISSILFESPYFKNADTVFLYYSVGTEVCTLNVAEKALKEGKKVAFPKCLDSKGKMEFYIISHMENSFIEGMFSISEPDTAKCKKACDSEKSLCIVPGLSFDQKGARLGYGKGYYDRFLSKFKGTSIGLCYNECLCEELPFFEYDRRVDMIITESQIYSFK